MRYVVEQPMAARFALVWDNTQKLVQTRNQSRTSKNEMLLWANGYAAKNRVDCSSAETSLATLKAADIPLTAFLPSADDYECLKDRMLVMVTRILAHHVPFFRQHAVITHHAKHSYTAESAVKSEIVCKY